MLDPQTERRQRTRNIGQSALLLGCLLAAAAGLGWLLFAAGLLRTLVLSALVVALRPRVPPRMVLALYRAEPLPVAAAPELHWPTVSSGTSANCPAGIRCGADHVVPITARLPTCRPAASPSGGTRMSSP